MSSASTEYLELIYFPDITGVYQRDIRLALVGGTGSNMHKIDAGVKAIADTLTALRNSLATVATSGSYTDLKSKPDIAAAVPLATTEAAGKVKPDGATILIDKNGVISAAVPVSIATIENAGIVKPDGKTILIDTNGTIRAAVEVAVATLQAAGIVKPDGTTITIDENGTIHAKDTYTTTEVDDLLRQMSDIFITNTDKNAIYNLTNRLMGTSTAFSGLGADILTVNSLAQELIN